MLLMPLMAILAVLIYEAGQQHNVPDWGQTAISHYKTQHDARE